MFKNDKNEKQFTVNIDEVSCKLVVTVDVAKSKKTLISRHFTSPKLDRRLLNSIFCLPGYNNVFCDNGLISYIELNAILILVTGASIPEFERINSECLERYNQLENDNYLLN